MGQLDNTLIFYIVGDNGASAEGTMNGVFNEMTYFNGVPETVPDILKHFDELGGPNSYRHYAAGWAVAGDTPFTWTKQVAGSYGGTRNRWSSTGPSASRPRAKSARSGITSSTSRRPFSKRPACPSPRSVNGTPQTPIEGVSMLYTFDDAKAKSTHKTQYFEIFGNRGIYTTAGWPAPSTARPGNPSRGDHCCRTTSGSSTHVEEDFSLGERSGREQSREAQGDAGAVPQGSDQEPRVAARRSLSSSASTPHSSGVPT